MLPGLEIQFDKPQRPYTPGEAIAGTIFVTTRSPALLQQASVRIEGKVSYEKRHSESSHARVQAKHAETDGSKQNTHRGQDYGTSVAPTSERPSSNEGSTRRGTSYGLHGDNWTLGVYKDDAETKKSQIDDWRALNTVTDMTVSTSREAAEPHPERHDRKTITILKTQDWNVISSPQWLEPGVTALKFSITLSASASGQDLVPTIQSFDGILENYYELVASVRVPAPVFSFVPLPLKAKRRITVVSPASGQDPNRAGSPGKPPGSGLNERPLRDIVHTKSGTAETRVGFWNSDSGSLSKLVDYYLGLDTAASWTPARVEATVASASTGSDVTEPSGLNGKLQVQVTLPNSSEEAWLVNIDKKSETKGTSEDESRDEPPSWNTIRTSPQIRVSSVKLGLLSSIVIAGFSSNHRVLWLEKSLLEPPHLGFDRILTPGVTDISALFQDSKLPSGVPPTITHTDLSVMHWLRVSVELQSITIDGTTQVPSTVELKIPITIS